MRRLTLFKDSLILVKKMKSTVDDERLFQTGATRCTKKILQNDRHYKRKQTKSHNALNVV